MRTFRIRDCQDCRCTVWQGQNVWGGGVHANRDGIPDCDGKVECTHGGRHLHFENAVDICVQTDTQRDPKWNQIIILTLLGGNRPIYVCKQL